MQVKSDRGLLLAGIVGAVAMTVCPAAAQTGADFYKGKTVTYIASTSPGGGYDQYGRLVAEFMQKHLPGSTFIVKNVPGAAFGRRQYDLRVEARRTDHRHFQYRPDLQSGAGRARR